MKGFYHIHDIHNLLQNVFPRQVLVGVFVIGQTNQAGHSHQGGYVLVGG